MADWWLVPESVQQALYDHLWDTVDPILNSVDQHNHETAVVGALGQALMTHPFESDGIRVSFDYRKFSEQVEEPLSGADGSIVVTVRQPNRVEVSKAALFQAKLLRANVPPRSQQLVRADANRLLRQVKTLDKLTNDGIGLIITRDNFYVIDAAALADHTADELRRPLRPGIRLVTLETYLGKWLPRCTRGDDRPEFVTRAKRPRGFTHQLEMTLTSDQPLLPLERVNWNDVSSLRPRTHRRRL